MKNSSRNGPTAACVASAISDPEVMTDSTSSHASAAAAGARHLRVLVDVSESRADHGEAVRRGIAGAYRDHDVQHAGVDDGVLVEQKHPGIAHRAGACDAEVQRARYSQVGEIQDESDPRVRGQAPQHPERRLIRAVVDDDERSDLEKHALDAGGQALVGMKSHEHGAYLAAARQCTGRGISLRGSLRGARHAAHGINRGTHA